MTTISCWVLGRWWGYGLEQGTYEQVTWTWWCWCCLYGPAVIIFYISSCHLNNGDFVAVGQ